MVFKEIFLLTWFVGLAGGGYAGGPIAGGSAVGSFVGGGQVAPPGSYGPDFNPILLQGTRGFPGIRARINQRAFQYASLLIAELLNQEIKRARIPPITQPVPGGIEGCILVYNLYVSRYRCPQHVALYPAPPNRLILQVQGVDVGVTGNLGGQVVILLPIQLFGIVQANLHQMSITVELAVERGPRGPYARMLSCNIQIGYADVYIQNGGLIGDLVNSMFRQQISKTVRDMVPGRVCAMLPSIIDEKLNSKLAGLPQSVAVTQMLSLFTGLLAGGAVAPSPQYCATQCGQTALRLESKGGSGQAPEIPQTAYGDRPQARGLQQRNYNTNQSMILKPAVRKAAAVVHAAPTATRSRTIAFLVGDVERATHHTIVRNKRQAQVFRQQGQQFVPGRNSFVQIVRNGRGIAGPGGFQGGPGGGPFPGPGGPYGPGPGGAGVGGFQPGPPRVPVAPIPPVPGAPAPMLVPPSPDLCARCPAPSAKPADDPMSFIRQLAASLDMRKLSDLYLSIQLLGTSATTNDFTVDLTGEFSPNAQGGTPFGAFPVQFPAAYDSHMAEFIVSDWTVNTLFYWLHRKQFLTFNIGPDTPKIGELLKTTCSEDEDEDGLEATELDEEDSTRRRRRRLTKKTWKTWRNRRGAAAAIMMMKGQRGKRQDAGGLADLGICFGDILPAVREKYPNQKINIQIRTVRAPSVIFSAARGGTVTLDLVADADIYIYGTSNKVGSITIAATIVIVAQIHGNRLVGTAEISSLKLSDRTGSLGLPQDALDNLGNLGKELVQKLLNDTLQKGIVINLPLSGIGGLPINIVNPSVRIIEHGLYIATDLTISPSLLGIEGPRC